ncbi:hypothetical protein VDG1235_2170 [Verrucomicrobiia bacterium DG1235]|nr:hypothetical protein VDG1235_2170 [Verrucomicrobiae bacterium DG1235]
MSEILDEVENADAFVLGSPMNFGTVTAVMKQFIERLVCYAYWPWGALIPKSRLESGKKFAVLVSASAAPSVYSRLSSKLVKLLKDAARLLGAGSVSVIFVGLAAKERRKKMSEHTRKKARAIGKELAAAKIDSLKRDSVSA